MFRACVLLTACMALSSLSRAEDKPDLATRVNRAIDRGAAHLLSKQNEDGSWRKVD